MAKDINNTSQVPRRNIQAGDYALVSGPGGPSMVNIDSIGAVAEERIEELQGWVAGRLTYETLAALQSSGDLSTSGLVEVWNDADPNNNGLYGSTGSAWVKCRELTSAPHALAKMADAVSNGTFRPQQVYGNFAITNWDTANTALTWTVAGGEIVVSASDEYSTPQFFDAGYSYVGGAAVYEITTTVDTNTSEDQNGAYLIFGSDGNYTEFLYASNGAIRIYDSSEGASTSVQFDEIAVEMGARLKMRVEIEESGRATLVAISPTGLQRSISCAPWSVAKGSIMLGWRTPGTGRIHSFKRLSQIPTSGTNAITNPDGRDGTAGWTVSGSGLEITTDGDELVLTNTSGVSRIASVEAVVPEGATTAAYHIDVIGADDPASTPVRLLLLQYSDSGPGLVDSGAELSRIDIPATSPAKYGYVFKGLTAIENGAARVVIAVSVNANGVVRVSRAALNFSATNCEYVEPLNATSEQVSRQAAELSAVDTRLTAVEETAALASSATESMVNVPIPDGFSFTDFGFDIYRGMASKKIVTTFSPESKRIGTSLTIYVDNAVGDDANDGTESAPLATLAAAIVAMNAAAEPATIIASSGDWFADGIGDFSAFNIEQNFNLESSSDTDRARFIQGIVPSSWTQDGTYTNLWYADISGAVPLWAFDGAHRDEYGEEMTIRPRNQSDANSIAGSCYIDGNRIFVHTLDSREPDSDVVVLQDLPSLDLRDRLFFLRRVEWLGGNGSSGGVYTAHADGDSCATECRFAYAYTGNAFAALRGRSGRVFLHRAVASYSRRLDGFNYHKGSQAQSSDVVEIECVGHHNGLMMSANNNGTTMHDGGRIVRINSDYSYNMNRNIHDINDGSEIWMLGVSASNAQTNDNDTYASANFVVGRTGYSDVTSAWLDTCTSDGASVSDYLVYAGGSMSVTRTDISCGGLANNVVEGTVKRY